MNPETAQPLLRWSFENISRDLVEGIVSIQAFIEFSADLLEIEAWGQPGVERGKQLARELIQQAAKA